MEEFQLSIRAPTDKEPPEGDLTLTNFTAFQNSDQVIICSAEHVSDADTSLAGAGFLFPANQSSQGVSDHSVPCSKSVLTLSMSSPMAALVPVTNSDIPVQQLQEQTLSPKSGFFSNKEELDHNDAISAEYQLLNYNSEEERGNDCSFTLNQENFSTAVIDDESCDDSFMQTMNDSAHAFNEQYRVKRDVRETFPNVPAEAFSPEAFISSIPMFCKISQKRPATIRPKLNTNNTSSYCEYGDADQCYSSPSAGVVIPNKILHSAFFMPGSSQGVPIAPKPCPNEKVSCYVLVVPAPLYHENCAPLKCLQMQQEQNEEDVDFVPSKTHMVVTERTIAPEGTPMQNTEFEHHSMQWNPHPLKPVRTALPSTILRVSPSPHEGSTSSPIITVSTTSTPIQPLQGRKQQYVIAQGNDRHSKGWSTYKDSLTTPTGEENHQPIYLQGLPPQGFRRLLKSKEGSDSERTSKRSLAPQFSEVSTSPGQEATVPQMEKSPLTCIKIKAPYEMNVPQTVKTNQDSSLQITRDLDTRLTSAEEIDLQTTVSIVSECRDNPESEPSLDCNVTESVEIIATPTTTGKRGEDKEKKKLRDRRYDAELKKAFHHLRQVVPCVQRNSTRGQILQETIKYIGILEKKVTDAGLWSTLQSLEAQRNAQLQGFLEETSTVEEEQGITIDNLLSPVSHDVPDICNNLVLRALTEEESCENSQEETATVLTSPLILISPISLPTEELSCTFVSPEEAVSVDSVDTYEEGITVAELPLSVPLQHIQFLTVDQSDETSVLAPQLPEQPSSQEPRTRLIPVVEVPAFTNDSVFSGKSHEVQKSPQQDSFLSAVTTISQESLSDLGVTLSPLLSPLGILFSPEGDRRQDPTNAVVVESTEETEAISSSSTDPASNDVMSSICSDMTSIAASVEVTTAQMSKRTLQNSKTRKSPRSSSIQIVPSLSPQLVDESKRGISRFNDRRVLQDQSNFDEANSPLIGNGRGRRRKLKDRSPELAFVDHTDENFCFATDQSCTPPSRVSGVLLTGKKKTPSSRGRVAAKRGRRM